MNVPFPAEIDKQKFQAAFSAPPILGVRTTRPPPGLGGPFRGENVARQSRGQYGGCASEVGFDGSAPITLRE
jgi:hypothetical protein